MGKFDFIKAIQRPIWGFATLYMDLQVFSGKWTITADSTIESTFWIINLLILSVLFGERAIKNLMPLIQAKLGAK